MPSADLAPYSSRAATATATAAALWCLHAAGLLSSRWTGGLLVLLVFTEFLAFTSPRTARRYLLPVAFLLFGLLQLRHMHQTEVVVGTARPLGAQLAGTTLVLLALAGGRRRDLLSRLGLITVSAALALSADTTRVVLPGLATAAAVIAVLATLEYALALGARVTATTAGAPPPWARTRLLAISIIVTVVVAALAASRFSLPHHTPTAFGSTQSSSSSGSGSSTAMHSSSRLSDVTSSVMNLRQRGKLSSAEIARVKPIDGPSEPLLWRAAVLTTYDGQEWSADGNDIAPVTSSGTERQDFVTSLTGQQLPLLSPGTPLSVTAYSNGSAPFNEAPQQPAVLPVTAYRVLSLLPHSGSTGQRQVSVAAPATDPATLELPSLPTRVWALAQQLTEGSATRQEAVDAVVTYLRTHYTYNLDSPVPAKGEDAVDDFLFRTRTGFCEQFASSAAVLLRAANVPTRIVTGYAPGEKQADGSWVLRGKDAHAWIEVEYPGTGWVAVDPTAGVPLAATSAARHLPSLKAVGAAIAVLALIGLSVFLVRRRRRDRGDALRNGLASLDTALGAARRRPTESLRDLADRLDLLPSEVRALATAERTFYGSPPPTDAEQQAAATVLRSAARRVVRERLNPRGRRRRPVAKTYSTIP